MSSSPRGVAIARTESVEKSRPGHDVEATTPSAAHDQDRRRALDGVLGEREVDLMAATDGNGDLAGLLATANAGHDVAQLPDFIGHRRSPVDPIRTVLPRCARRDSHDRIPSVMRMWVRVRRRDGVRPAWY